MAEKRTPGRTLEDMLGQLDQAKAHQENSPQIMEDGSVRVKRRKRRTKQSVYKKRLRRKRIRWASALSLLALLLSLWLLTKLVQARYEEDGFIQDLSAQLSGQLGADVELKGFATKRGQIYLDKLSIRNVGNSSLQELVFEDVKASLHSWSWLKKDWDLPMLKIARGRAVLRANSSAPEIETATNEAVKALQLIKAQQIEVKHFDLLWGKQGLDEEIENNSHSVTIPTREESTPRLFEAGKIVGSSLFAAQQGNGWTFNLRDGVYEGEKNIGEDKLRLYYGNGMIRRDSIELNALKLHYGDIEEAISLSGNIATAAGSSSKVTASIQKVPVNKFFYAPWSEWIEGTLEAELRYTLDGAKESLATLKGDCNINNARIISAPGLSIIAKATKDPSYANLEMLGPIQFDYFHSQGATFIRNLTSSVQGLFSLKGNMGWRSSGALEGKLLCGLHDNAFRSFEEGVPPFFTNSLGEGLQWATVTLGGFLSDPKQDLHERIASLTVNKRRTVASSVSTFEQVSQESLQPRAPDNIAEIIEDIDPALLSRDPLKQPNVMPEQSTINKGKIQTAP